jgi:selenide,water dikinase
MEKNFARKGIEVHTSLRVTEVTAQAVVAGAKRIAADAVVWVTGAASPPWLAQTGLARNDQGFLRINTQLQSVSHANVFAAGDCATIDGLDYPKSGVYAVRQGPVLAQNLLRALRGDTPEGYTPQPRSLALISTGEQHAIASWGPLAWHGNWVWRWKDRIDRVFMDKYRAI